jgi:subtilisin family serine protease
VRLVNLSISGGPFPPDCDHLSAFNEAVAQLSAILRDRGGLIIASAGNDYSLTLMGSPACVSSVVSVGAVDAADQVMPFSDATPSLDLLAPGDHVPCAGSYGGIITLTGTSAAAPHVTGAAALVLSAAPGLSAQELEDRLRGRGVPVVDGRNGATYPRVDAFRALVIPVEVASHPAVQSPRSRGRGLSVRVEPPPPFLAADLDPASFTLSAAGGPPVPVEIREAELGDGDGDGIPDLTIHFNRRQVMSGLSAPGAVTLTLEGKFSSGLDCRGKTSLRMLKTGPRGIASEPAP